MTQPLGTPQRLPLHHLAVYHQNPRQGNIQIIAESLRANGQYRPIVVNRGTRTGREWEVLAGNHTLMAARSLEGTSYELPELDCYVVDVDDDTAARIVLVDNRSSDVAGYDDQALIALLEQLGDGLEGTGYCGDDLAELVAGLDDGVNADTTVSGDPDEIPEIEDDQETIASLGDVIELGRHRVWCGDSTDSSGVVGKLMGDERADCVWKDPPYGVDYVGKTKDALTIKNDGAVGLAGLLAGAFNTIMRAARPGAAVYVAHADTERVTFETAMREAGLLVRQNLVWVKNAFVLGHSDYQYQHEPILYGFTPGGEGRLGRGGDRWYGSNAEITVLEYDKPNRNAAHPTMKPVALVQAMLKNSCPRAGIVLDVFGGSGSTLVAAHELGMTARLVEYDPRYVDVICRRYEMLTHTTPILNGKPVSFTGD